MNERPPPVTQNGMPATLPASIHKPCLKGQIEQTALITNKNKIIMDEKKKKKAYVKPEMRIEEFTPNEYVGACFQVVCDVMGQDSEPTYGKADNSHNASGKGCNDPTQQFITELSNKTWTVKELGTDNTSLETQFTPISDPNAYTANKSLEWTTTKTNPDRTYHHEGHVIINGTSNHS